MELTEAQDNIVRELVAMVPPGWERIVTQVEMLEQPGGMDMDSMCLVITRGENGECKDANIVLEEAVRRHIMALYLTLRAQRPDSILGSLELMIDASGRYEFEFSYDPPRRLNGIWDREKEAKMDNYLATYAAEHPK